MNAEIGEHAGRVWKHLNGRGETTMTSLVKDTKLNQRQADRAVGWLAREGKVQLRKAANKELISLR